MQSNHRETSTWYRWELPTWAVLIGCYSAWLALTWHGAELPVWLLVGAGGYTLALYGSLQHETLHGHPTPVRGFNTFLVWLPLSLWLPYTLYRSEHLAHHRAETLTHPDLDTESFYVTANRWAALSPLTRTILLVNQTLMGRLLLGPWIAVLRYWKQELIRLARHDYGHLHAWILQLLGIGLVYWWVERVCGLAFWQYILCFVWPGLSLTLLRSYFEHRPAIEPGHRTAIVEGCWLTELLFLNNNYHVVHHEQPRLPWYALKTEYLKRREQIQRHNGGFVFTGYSALARRYAWKVKDSPVYPSPAGSRL
jgi:fatty acid desaturase